MINEIKTRRSIRKYIDKPIDKNAVSQILESGRLAPSGNNTQPWRYIVVRSDETRDKLASASNNQRWMTQAPVHIVCVADIRCREKGDEPIVLDENSSSGNLKKIIRDTAISTGYIMLEAQRQRLGTCWIAWFEQNDIRPVLNIPEDKYVVGIITLGYADENPKPRPRKSPDEIIRYETW